MTGCVSGRELLSSWSEVSGSSDRSGGWIVLYDQVLMQHRLGFASGGGAHTGNVDQV